jgi:CRISPR/Cas system CSM-associated protein Csm3 (group 7 of RAMP superfamily)
MRGEPEPKPFLYVSIPHTRPVKKRAPNHDRFNANTLTGKLALQFEVVSEYLFVGSGGYDYRDDMVFYSFARSHDELVIPGTSIKGAVRSLVEALSNSCVSLLARRGRPGGTAMRGGEERSVPRTHQPCESSEDLCPACRLFGMAGEESYGGRVSFADGQAQTLVGPEIVKIGELYRPQNVERSSRKFYAERRFIPTGDVRPERDHRLVEAVRNGTVFTTALTFTNLVQEELSLVLHALGIPHLHTVKIGGAKPRGFGAVRFEPTQLIIWRIIGRDPFAEPERKGGEELREFIREVCRATDLVQADLLQAYQEQMVAEADQPAPRRLY